MLLPFTFRVLPEAAKRKRFWLTVCGAKEKVLLLSQCP